MNSVLFLGDVGIVILITMLYWFITTKREKQKTEYPKFFLVVLSAYFICFSIIVNVLENGYMARFICWILLFPTLFLSHYFHKFRYTEKRPYFDMLFFILIFVVGSIICMYYFSQIDM